MWIRTETSGSLRPAGDVEDNSPSPEQVHQQAREQANRIIQEKSGVAPATQTYDPRSRRYGDSPSDYESSNPGAPTNPGEETSQQTRVDVSQLHLRPKVLAGYGLIPVGALADGGLLAGEATAAGGDVIGALGNLLKHPLTWIIGALGGAVIAGPVEQATDTTTTDTDENRQRKKLFVDSNISIAIGGMFTDPSSLNSNEIARVANVLTLGRQLTVTPTTAIETKNLVLPVTPIAPSSIGELGAVKAQLTAANVGNGKQTDIDIVAEAILSVPKGGSVDFATADKGIYDKLYAMDVGDPSKAQGANRLPFSVQIQGRTLNVIPVTP